MGVVNIACSCLNEKVQKVVVADFLINFVMQNTECGNQPVDTEGVFTYVNFMTVHSLSIRPFATTHTTSVSKKAIIFSKYSNTYRTLRNSSTLTAVPKFISHTNFDQFKKIQKTSLHVQDSRAL